jgi:hypothetical protein
MVNVLLLVRRPVKTNLSVSPETNVLPVAAALKTKLLIAVMAFIAKRVPFV